MTLNEYPLYPRKRTCAVQLGMSALGPKAEVKPFYSSVGFTPRKHLASGEPQMTAFYIGQHEIDDEATFAN